MIKIENGVVQVRNGFTYSTTTVDGQKNYFFTAPEGMKPEIGDFISNGLLVKRRGPQISNDGERKWPGEFHQASSWEDPSYADVVWVKTK